MPKQVIDDLDPTENGEASEETHCASDQSKLGLRCHLAGMKGTEVFISVDVYTFKHIVIVLQKLLC